ncbi:MAG TPA: flagellar basal body-associated FliL family protein [Symbiobacteriaceae bacterium]|jgi:flagellar basal body-associated protein FliL
MSRGVKILLIVMGVLLVAALGGGSYVAYRYFMKPATTAAPAAPPTPEELKKKEEAETVARDKEFHTNLETVKYVKLSEFTTELADQFSMVKVTITLAVKDESAAKLVGDMKPAIERAVLFQLRSSTAKQIEGAAGQAGLEKTLDKEIRALNEKLSSVLYKVLVTQLTLQQ